MLLSLLFCIAVALAQFVRPKLPSQDSFYDAPSNLTSYSEGDIISYRKAPSQIRSIYAPLNIKEAWQLLVRSQNARGEPTAIVSTILVPHDPNPDLLVSYQFAQDSATMDCLPSYGMLFGAGMGTFVAQAEMLLCQTALAKGWYVVVPDYEGPDGAFTSGWQAAYATLDSLKAALNSERFSGLSPDAKAAIWGYSGGSFASSWAASLQPSYKPDLKKNLVGAALGGWVTNWTDVIWASEGTISAGLIPNILNGYRKSNPDLQEVFDDEFNEDKRKRLYDSADNCLMTSILQYAFRRLFSGRNPWTSKGWAFFLIPEIKDQVLNNTLGRNDKIPLPEIPLFAFHGIPDEIVPFSGSEETYENFCDRGIESFEFAVSNTTGHVLEAAEGSPAALAWLQKRFDGEEPVKGCERTVRSTNVLYPGADVQLTQLIKTIPSSFSGKEIGESTRNITESTTWTGLLQNVLGGLLTFVGPIPLKRDLRPVYSNEEFDLAIRRLMEGASSY